MTEATPLASEQITQEDREAAHRLMLDYAGDNWRGLLKGDEDRHTFVQAFARHRIAALSASPAPNSKDVFGAVDFGSWAGVDQVRQDWEEKKPGVPFPASPAPSGQAEDHSSLRYQIRWSRPGGAEEMACSDLTMRVCFARIMQAAKNNGGVMVHAIVPSAPSGQGVSGEERRLAIRENGEAKAREWVKDGVIKDDEIPTFVSGYVMGAKHETAAPGPSCAPGEVERRNRILAAEKAAGALVESLYAGGVLHGISGGKDRGFDKGHAYAWREIIPTVNRLRAALAELSEAGLAALSPQGLDAKEGDVGKVQRLVDAARPFAWCAKLLVDHADEEWVEPDSGAVFQAGNFRKLAAAIEDAATPSQGLDAKEGGE